MIGEDFTWIDFPDAKETYAQGINDSGQVVSYFIDAGDVSQAFSGKMGISHNSIYWARPSPKSSASITAARSRARS
jgi:hypothetical protein